VCFHRPSIPARSLAFHRTSAGVTTRHRDGGLEENRERSPAVGPIDRYELADCGWACDPAKRHRPTKRLT
jgi:hypothetical protein